MSFQSAKLASTKKVLNLRNRVFFNSLETRSPPQENADYMGVFASGRSFDIESGLTYNHFRSYRAPNGRYDQSDPVGLRAGVNTYAYVRNSPLMWFDRKGLSPSGDIGELISQTLEFLMGESAGMKAEHQGEEFGKLIPPNPGGGRDFYDVCTEKCISLVDDGKYNALSVMVRNNILNSCIKGCTAECTKNKAKEKK